MYMLRLLLSRVLISIETRQSIHDINGWYYPVCHPMWFIIPHVKDEAATLEQHLIESCDW
jgi:hypothetical protein